VKKNIFWHDICYAYLADHLAQDLLQPAILAVFGRRLPFWQYPLFGGVRGLPPLRWHE